VRIRTREGDPSIHLDFVPMVDTLFNLVIFFLLATTIKQAEREMNIALPSAGASAPLTTALRELVVNVDAEGKIVVAGRMVEPEGLRDMIKDLVGSNSDQKVSVRADRTTAYANVVRALDMCKAGGVTEPYLDTIEEQ
jgi:biopolymer transport protein ExbD